MADFRIKFGLALGPEGSAAATSSQHLITPGDTTPDVSLGAFFQTANTSATTITYFDLVGRGGDIPGGISEHQGKVIVIRFQDAVTTIQNGGNIWLSNTQGTFDANSILSR